MRYRVSTKLTVVDRDSLPLCQAIFGFLCQTTTGLKGGSGQPVLLLGSQRTEATRYLGEYHEPKPMLMLATAPSLHAAVKYLSRVAEEDNENNFRTGELSYADSRLMTGVIESLMLLVSDGQRATDSLAEFADLAALVVLRLRST